ncbi:MULTISPECIES: glutathione S-transferase [unclassified Caballeronia]|uniref:glutathione S-transferase family protein n=1 Tax=unclassified Caballeronia TaxID=2646786 RepID=UPI0028592374|nr:MULTISPECIES: glutathione S-transferase [unclassified Caballeronia]MDR5750966.1 glutathione S-transferase [Caballeronia sp. LZ024]MDR5844899.1 glutathione S-transferase [Caballeronia sp. LZ031]
MIKLYGFPLSNYFNKVKFVLLEHDIPFEEVRAGFNQDEATLARSPLGKVPYIETDAGPLCESQVIVEYLASAHPDKPIFAADPYHAAKERELATFIDLHLELVARDLYKQAFFGGAVTDYTKSRVEKLLTRHIAGFARIAKFAPYVAGPAFSIADVCAFVSLPLVGLATKAVYGRDFVLDAGIDWKTHGKMIGERPAAQKVTADRLAYMEAQKRG